MENTSTDYVVYSMCVYACSLTPWWTFSASIALKLFNFVVAKMVHINCWHVVGKIQYLHKIIAFLYWVISAICNYIFYLKLMVNFGKFTINEKFQFLL